MYYHSAKEIINDLKRYGNVSGFFCNRHIEIELDEVYNIAYMYITSHGVVDEVELSCVEELEDTLYFIEEELY